MASPNGENNCLLTDPVKTGEWLSEVLKKHGMLEHELAELLDVSYARVMNWVTGKRGMRLYMIIAICTITEMYNEHTYSVIRAKAIRIYQELKP